MRIAVVTITRDRLEYTKRTFESLRAKAGCGFKHYVLDNGSEDGTVDWLADYAELFEEYDAMSWVFSESNIGIGAAWETLVKDAIREGAEIIVKVDNDCLPKSDGVLLHLAAIVNGLAARGEKWVLSPRVEGIVNQPRRIGSLYFDPFRIGETPMVGGLFLAAPAELYRDYPWPTNLPKAQGWDSALCAWARANGWRTGYVEDLVVEHMDGTDAQARKYPLYQARKMRELGKVAAAQHWERLARESGGVE